MARKMILLDCTCLTVHSRRGQKAFARLRYYYGSRSATFDRSMSDQDTLMHAYVQYSQGNPENPITKARVEQDYQAWKNGDCAPDYLCSELRRALRDRDHRLISIEHLDALHHPIAA